MTPIELGHLSDRELLIVTATGVNELQQQAIADRKKQSEINERLRRIEIEHDERKSQQLCQPTPIGRRAIIASASGGSVLGAGVFALIDAAFRLLGH